jgi:Putative outer membrane beta-barrel porin, MtrB/PioB
MRQLAIHLVCAVCIALSSVAHAQTTQPPAAPAAAPQPATPEVTRSLFEPTWRQFSIGGRFTSVDGDQARFQRYQDIRDGVLFHDARFANEDPAGNWLFQSAADNVGWRDQRYFANYERIGRFVITGLWDEIPQFYSVDTATPYTGSNGTLVLDDATQRAVQNGQFTPPLSAWIPTSVMFVSKPRRLPIST